VAYVFGATLYTGSCSCIPWTYLCFYAAGLEKKVRELYDAVCRLEEEKYEWEGKLGRQTEEVCVCPSSLTMLSDHHRVTAVREYCKGDYESQRKSPTSYDLRHSETHQAILCICIDVQVVNTYHDWRLLPSHAHSTAFSVHRYICVSEALFPVARIVER